LGNQGGKGAFQSMARNYELSMSDSQAQIIVDSWRDANQWAVTFWSQLERAAKDAVSSPGEWFSAGRIRYIFLTDLMGGTLMCKLPGEHVIQYPQARIEDVEVPWGGTRPAITALKASYKPKADAKEWPRGALYGGLLAENCTQATAACLLRDALRRATDVVMHVHDEIVLEVPYDEAEDAAKGLQVLMETNPAWSTGLPLDAKISIMRRYGK